MKKREGIKMKKRETGGAVMPEKRVLRIREAGLHHNQRRHTPGLAWDEVAYWHTSNDESLRRAN